MKIYNIVVPLMNKKRMVAIMISMTSAPGIMPGFQYFGIRMLKKITTLFMLFAD